jgi:hypothetical protein
MRHKKTRSTQSNNKREPPNQTTKENHPPPFSPLFDEVKFAKTKKQFIAKL